MEKKIRGRKYDLDRLECWLGRGLCDGGGILDNGQGQLCVEQAVAMCAGIEVKQDQPTDHPSCVNKSVANFGIGLNDSAWSSDAARAEGLRRFAYAQLGTGDGKFDVDRFRADCNVRADELGRVARRHGFTGDLDDIDHSSFSGLANLLARDCNNPDAVLTAAANIAAAAIRKQGFGVDPPRRRKAK